MSVQEQTELETTTKPLGRSAQRLCLVAAVGLISFYLLSSLFIASRRLFWFDEISTVLIARIPGYATMFKALSEAVDSMPPAYYLLVRGFDEALGPSELGARLPSVLALVVGFVVTFDCARRLTDNLHALAALAVLTCSLLPYYGYEARPYALYFMLVSMGLWLWLHSPNTKSWAAVFGATIFLAFTVHFYSALCLLPYMLFDATRIKHTRFPSSKTIAGILGVMFGVAFCSRQILGFKQYSRGYWAPPSLSALVEIFGEFFPFGLFIGALALIWVAWTAKPRRFIGQPMLPSERVGWFFLSIPIVGYVGAKFITNAFYNRYFIGMLSGLAVAFACSLWRRFGHRPSVSVGIVLIALACGVSTQIVTTLDPSKIDPPSADRESTRMKQMMSMEAALLKDGKKMIAFRADDTLGLEARYYSSHPGSYALLLEPGMKVMGRINVNLARYTPMRFWGLDELRLHANETALVDPSEATLESIKAAGLQIRPYNSKQIKIFYLQANSGT